MAIKINVSDMLGRRKMTQKTLSNKANIRPATISALYHETIKRLDIDQLNSLCTVLNCLPGDLFEYIPDEKKVTEATLLTEC